MLNISRTLKARPDLWAILSFYAGILRLFHTLWKLGELFRASNYLRPSEHSGQMISYLVVRKPRHYHLSGISAGSDCCFGVFNQPRPEKPGANLLHNLISLPEIPKASEAGFCHLFREPHVCLQQGIPVRRFISSRIARSKASRRFSRSFRAVSGSE